MRFCMVELLEYVKYDDCWDEFERNKNERSFLRLITNVEKRIKKLLEEEFAKGGYTICVIPKQNFKWFNANVTKAEFKAEYVSALQFEIKVFDDLGQIVTLERIPFKRIAIHTFCNYHTKKFQVESNVRGIKLMNFIEKS